MALVKCPECGKENVSSTATACPQCGFNIKEYYEDIERKEKNEKRHAEIEKNIKNISDQAASLKKDFKFNKSFLKNHKKVSVVVLCVLILLIGFVVKSILPNHQYSASLDGKSVYLGESSKSVKRKYGKDCIEIKGGSLICIDKSYIALRYNSSNKVSWINVDKGKKATLCNIKLGDLAVDVLDDLGIDDLKMDDYTEDVLIAFKDGKVTKSYIADDMDDFAVQQIFKKSDTILGLKFDDLKVTDITVADSQDILDNTTE